jgi:predicted AAA+ superfamily ATPase
MASIKRWQESNIKKALESSRIVILSGARQCGKTTMASNYAITHQDITFRSLDDIAMLTAAKADPHGFLLHHNRTMIIDEIQRAPELLIAIKKHVDVDNSPGQFLITGSADIQSLPTVTESLAGRVQKVRLHPLSQGEIFKSIHPNFITRTFQEQFNEGSITKYEVLKLAMKGGFPESVLAKNEAISSVWCANYVDTLLEHDLRSISNIKRLDVIRELMKITAAWSSKFMDKTGIMSSLSITKPTFDSYFSVLKNMFLVDVVPSWIKTDYEYASKRGKIFMTDTGLMTGILGWNLGKIELDQDKCGKLIETFIYNQLIAEIDIYGNEYSLSHYRDSEKREIDFIVQDNDNNILAIEVKSGSAIPKDSFKHLRWFKEQMRKNVNKFTGIVLYTGEHIIPFGEHLYAVPIASMWGF